MFFVFINYSGYSMYLFVYVILLNINLMFVVFNIYSNRNINSMNFFSVSDIVSKLLISMYLC